MLTGKPCYFLGQDGPRDRHHIQMVFLKKIPELKIVKHHVSVYLWKDIDSYLLILIV